MRERTVKNGKKSSGNRKKEYVLHDLEEEQVQELVFGRGYSLSLCFWIGEGAGGSAEAWLVLAVVGRNKCSKWRGIAFCR